MSSSYEFFGPMTPRTRETLTRHLEKMEHQKMIVGIIPARYGSTRFPGKPLALLQGKPMIQWTYENAKKATKLDYVVVATDDERIAKAVQDFGGDAIMTEEECPNGTVRCWDAFSTMYLHLPIDHPVVKRGISHVINIQGDEPMIEPEHIDQLVDALVAAEGEYVMAALAAPIKSEEEWRSLACSKVVMDASGYAMYFSRSPIPFSKSGAYHPEKELYYKNCGMYGYNLKALEKLSSEDNVALQNEEDLEQLKALFLGIRIKMDIVENAVTGIDFPHQLERLNKKLDKQTKPIEVMK